MCWSIFTIFYKYVCLRKENKALANEQQTQQKLSHLNLRNPHQKKKRNKIRIAFNLTIDNPPLPTTKMFVPTQTPLGAWGEGLAGIILSPTLTLGIILGLLGDVVGMWIFCWNLNALFLLNLVIANLFMLVSLLLRM